MKKIFFVIMLISIPLIVRCQNFGMSMINGMMGVMNQISQNAYNDRSQIRNAISNKGGCTTAALTVSKGAAVIVDGNGYQFANGLPQGFINDINTIRNNKKGILDICITEGGYWSILTEDYMVYGNYPQCLRDAIPKMYCPISLSFNDAGQYVAVQNDGKIVTNIPYYKDFYNEHLNDYGHLLSINLFGSGSVWCYQNYTTFCGSIPIPVKNGMNSLNFHPKFMKFNNHGDFVAFTTTSFSYDIANVNARSNAALTSNWPTNYQNSSVSGGYMGGAIINNVSTPSYNNFNNNIEHRTQCRACNNGTCKVCRGTGRVERSAVNGNFIYGYCTQCNNGRCKYCNGTGWISY